jgi:DNA repair exonuclease SbcCD ATPase subunit
LKPEPSDLSVAGLRARVAELEAQLQKVQTERAEAARAHEANLAKVTSAQQALTAAQLKAKDAQCKALTAQVHSLTLAIDTLTAQDAVGATGALSSAHKALQDRVEELEAQLAQAKTQGPPAPVADAASSGPSMSDLKEYVAHLEEELEDKTKQIDYQDARIRRIPDDLEEARNEAAGAVKRRLEPVIEQLKLQVKAFEEEAAAKPATAVSSCRFPSASLPPLPIVTHSMLLRFQAPSLLSPTGTAQSQRIAELEKKLAQATPPAEVTALKQQIASLEQQLKEKVNPLIRSVRSIYSDFDFSFYIYRRKQHPPNQQRQVAVMRFERYENALSRSRSSWKKKRPRMSTWKSVSAESQKR